MAVAEGRAHIDPTTLHDALGVANVPTLVPLLFQLTGDPKWTRDPYRPTRARGTDDHDDAGLPPDVRNEIRAAVEEAVLAWAGGRPAARPAPTGRELLDLMALSVAEEVPEEYESMTAEHMGFRAKALPTVATSVSRDFHVLVIGAGAKVPNIRNPITEVVAYSPER